jgi:RecA-family ATPase
MSVLDFPDVEIPDDEQGSAVDRRYLQLTSAIVDATRLDQLPKADPLITDVLCRDSLAWLGGKPGSGKSLFALDWSCCIATGWHWRGYAVTSGPVLFIIAEGAHGVHERLQAWEHVNGRQVPANRLVFLPVAVQLRHGLDVAAVAMLAQELQPGLIVIDTQARCTVGADENSSRDMGQFIDSLDRIRIMSGACLLPVHHEARAGDNLRGSSALEGAADTVMRTTRDGDIFRLDCTKQKDGPEFAPIVAMKERGNCPVRHQLRCPTSPWNQAT